MDNIEIDTNVTISDTGGAVAKVVITKNGVEHTSKWIASFRPTLCWTTSNRFARKYKMHISEKLKVAYSAAKSAQRSVKATIQKGAERAEQRHRQMLPDY